MTRTASSTVPLHRRDHRRRSLTWIIGAGAALALPLSVAVAQDNALPSGFDTKPLLKTSQTRDNDPIAYPNGNPEITAVTATIEPGGRTPLHEHPGPTFIYLLDGEVELETEGGDPHTYGAGEAYIEALDRQHQLFNRSNAPARLLVVFIGETGEATTLTPEAPQ